MENQGDISILGGPNPPQSLLQASIDEKGRLKVPAEAKEYLGVAGVTKVFITTLDMQLARIYPMEVWQHNLRLFQNARGNAEAAKRLAFAARALGGEAELDKGDRLLIPAKLRDALGLEKQPVHLEFHNGGINILKQAVYEERMRMAVANLESDRKALEEFGLL